MALPRRRVISVGFLGLFAILFWSWGGERDIAPDSAKSGPDATTRRTPWSAARLRRQERSRNAPSSEPERLARAPSHYLVVQVREATEGVSILMPPRPFDPGRWWPLPEAFDHHPVALAYEDLLAGELDEADWLDQAHAAGLAAEEVGTEDPWQAILALELARRDAIDERRQRADEKRAELAPTARATDAWLAGGLDTQDLVSLASAIITAHPDHPASEYARLYAVEGAATGIGGSTREERTQHRQHALAMARDMLHHTEDPIVAGQAVERIIGLDGEDGLHMEDLDALEARIDDAPDAIAELPVTALGLDHALKWGDPERIEAWVSRYEAAIAFHCRGSLDDDLQAACDTHADNRDDAIGGLGLRDPSDAADWKQAWTFAAYRCAEAHLMEEFSVSGAWSEGRWRFAEDEPRTPYAACVIRRSEEGPLPDEPLRLTLRVIGQTYVRAPGARR